MSPIRVHIVLLLLLLLSVQPLHAQEKGYERVTNLPVLHIDTYSGRGINSKTTYELCRVHYTDEADVTTFYDSVEVRGRGNSTWNMAKKPYRLRFASKERFLGKGRANARLWTLLANCGDKTMLRNAVTSIMGEFLGLPFNPAYKFCDLYLNGSYRGTYQISDQVQVKKHRVDIAEQEVPLTDESDISGGYLLEVDGFHDGNHFTTSRYGATIRIHYPDEDDIDSRQTAYIRDYVGQFESRLQSSAFADSLQGYRPLVDSVSLAAWYIATEVSANIDGFYSTYFYKQPGDPRLYWGPLWDYDIAYGNDTRKGDTRRVLMVDEGYGDARTWMVRMGQDPWFARLIGRTYHEAIDAGLEARLVEATDSLAALLARSQQLNYERWGISTRMYNERVLYSSYDQYVADLKQFIHDHCAYLLTAFDSRMPDEPTPPFRPKGFYYRMLNAGNGLPIDVLGGAVTPGSSICISHAGHDVLTAQWEVVPSTRFDGMFTLLNRASGLALTDPTVGASTATTNTGTALALAVRDDGDDRQAWQLVPQGTDGLYNLTNIHTQHTANLSGGNSADGTRILSYTTDGRNSSSNNRLWRFEATDTIPVVPEAITSPTVEPEEYALAYDPVHHRLHFASATPEALTFEAMLYNADGRLVARFNASDAYDTQSLPSGLYLIKWTVDNHLRSAKLFLK